VTLKNQTVKTGSGKRTSGRAASARAEIVARATARPRRSGAGHFERTEGGRRLPPLADRIRPGVGVLLVGINPGIRSAETGHHFAGYSNRFWRLLHGSGLVDEPITYEQDWRLPEWGLGITNLVARATPGIEALTAADYQAGRRRLLATIRRFHPSLVALVGITLYRALFPDRRSAAVKLGLQEDRLEGAAVFLVPNPSGRNANYAYEDMLEAFRALKHASREARRPGLEPRRRP
jgi:double-stranded uracil-DNA glycosylase